MPIFPGFFGGSYEMQSPIANAQRTVNMYFAALQAEGSAGGKALFPIPGRSIWSQVVTVGTRAALVAEGRLFVVLGATFYEFDQNGNATNRGAVVQDAYPAQIVFNGKVGGQLGISSGGNVYAFNLATNTFSGPFLAGRATQLAFAGGFGVAFDINLGQVHLSNLDDLTTWDLGTFFQRSLFGDPWQAMFVDANNLVWLIGTDTFEVWENTGVGTQPFAPLTGLVGRYGIVAPFAFSLSALGNCWLARNAEGVGPFVITQGGTPRPISNHGVDTAIDGYVRTSDISNAEVMSYHQNGHTFAVLSFPSVPATWACDLEMALNGQQAFAWAERGIWNPALGRYDLWGPRVHCQAYGKHLVGDRSTGIIAAMEPTTATELDGSGIRWLRRAPAVLNEHKRTPISQLELLMDVGQGVAVGQGAAPVVMLRTSEDGYTWGNEHQASTGAMGKYRTRAYWTRLGAPPYFVAEVTGTDPVPRRGIVNAYLNNLEQVA